MEKLKLLVDMDGVVVNLHFAWQNWLQKKYGNKIDFSKIESSITDECLEKWGITSKQCIEPFYEKNFWKNLPPQDDVLEYLPEISKKYDLIIVTKPDWNSPYCAYEKHQWLLNHFGSIINFKLIATDLKSYISGDIIIDDMIKNLEKCYDQGIFTICYNQFWNSKITKINMKANNWYEINTVLMNNNFVHSLNEYKNEFNLIG